MNKVSERVTRAISIGRYFVETKNTMRQAATEFGVAPSTVCIIVSVQLPEINPELASKVKNIIEYHKAIRHLRGGEATKIKHGRSRGSIPQKLRGMKLNEAD